MAATTKGHERWTTGDDRQPAEFTRDIQAMLTQIPRDPP